MYQVVPYQEFEQLRLELRTLKQTVERLEAAQPEWLREQEAQQLTGLSQATLARARKKPDTLLVFKTAGGLRYLRSSVLAFNEARLVNRSRYSRAA